jgi:hypothetical protein
MQLRTLCDLELRYTSVESIDFGAGGVLYSGDGAKVTVEEVSLLGTASPP